MSTPALKITADEILNLPEDNLRHELLDGVHVMSPSPQWPHQRLVGRLHLALGNWTQQTHTGEVALSPFDVVLSGFDVVVPDLIFISTAHLARLTRKNLQGPPDLAVEIISPGTRRRDEVAKRDRYRALGVAKYWIVYPEEKQVVVHHWPAEPVTLTVGGVLTSPQLPGFALPLDELFRD